MRDCDVPEPGDGQRLEDRLAESALRVGVLDEDKPAGLASCGGEGGDVHRLDGVEVDHPGRDALVAERVGGGDAVVQGDTTPDEGDVVLRCCLQHLGAADGKLLAGRIEDGIGAASGAQVFDAGPASHRLDKG